MNRRNADALLLHNPRSLYPIVDNKLALDQLCQRLGVPTPTIFDQVNRHGEITSFLERVRTRGECVLKPAMGSGGRGVMLLHFSATGECYGTNQQPIPDEQLRLYLADGISGAYSIGGKPDAIFAQERIGLHSAFVGMVPAGIPDIRVILYRGAPAMAMLRLPTRQSRGRANLHQGGLGIGVDLASGITFRAVAGTTAIQKHPDTSYALLGFPIPYWSGVLEISSQIARAIGLGLLGIDIVLDPKRGPLLLEANARPGLNIQVANDAGLFERFQIIDSKTAQG